MKKVSYACILLAGVLWGLNGWLFRILSDYGLDAMQVIFLKMLIASGLLGVYLLCKNPGFFRVRPRDFWIFLGSGIISMLMFNFCYYTSMAYTTVAVTVSLMYTMPGFVVIFSAFLFKEKITLRKVAALVIIFIGCASASGLFAGDQMMTAAGIFWGIAAGFCYSFYTIFNRVALDRGYETPTITFYSILVSVVCVTPFVDFGAMVPLISPSVAGYCVAIAVVTCLAPYIFYTIGMKKLEAGEASMLATSEPVTAAIVSVVVLGEPFSFFVLLGVVLIILGIVVMNLRTKALTTIPDE